MKKVKVLLTAITIFAVVGGALAFKANRSGTYFCRPFSQGSGTCPTAHKFKIDASGTSMYCTNSGTNCNLLTTVVQDDL